jgi:hypothetical protein
MVAYTCVSKRRGSSSTIVGSAVVVSTVGAGSEGPVSEGLCPTGTELEEVVSTASPSGGSLWVSAKVGVPTEVEGIGCPFLYLVTLTLRARLGCCGLAYERS